MRFWLGIILIIAFASCKQDAFVKRHYLSGVYFEGHSKLNQTKSYIYNKPEKKEAATVAELNVYKTTNKETTTKSCGDTLILNGKSKIPCKVTQIDQKFIHYRSCFKNDSLDHTIANENVKEISFYNGKKEFFSKNNPESNPFLTSSVYKPATIEPVKKYNKRGMSIFGLVLLFISGIITLFAAPAIGLILFVLGFFGLVIVGSDKQEKDIFKFFYYLGKFLGILASLFGILLLTGIFLGLLLLILFSL